MARVAVRQLARIAIKNAHKVSDEAVRRAIGGRDPVQPRRHLREALRLLNQHLDARLQPHHQQGSRHAFARNVAQHQCDAALTIREEIVIIAADRPAGGVVAGQIDAADLRRNRRQKTLLDHGGLFEIARHQLPGLLNLGEARLLDADGRHVRHHGEHAQVVLGEFAQQRRRIHINDADDLIARLQRHRHQRADVLLDNALAGLQRVVHRRIAHQHRSAAVEHAVAHHSADVEALAFVGAHFKPAVLGGQQDAAIGLHGRDREVEDELKQLRQRPITGEFVARAHQCRDLRSRRTLRILLSVVFDDAFEIRDDGGGTDLFA